MNLSEHLLTCLSEECVEVSKDIHKALRFGLEDRNVLNPTGPTNRARIIEELNDLFAVVEMLIDEAILPAQWEDRKLKEAKQEKVREFVRYAKKVKALQTGERSEP